LTTPHVCGYVRTPHAHSHCPCWEPYLPPPMLGNGAPTHPVGKVSLSQFMPDISAPASPLSGMSKAKVWNWGPPHERCFASLKSIACKYPILKLIDYDRAKQIEEYIHSQSVMPLFQALDRITVREPSGRHAALPVCCRRNNLQPNNPIVPTNRRRLRYLRVCCDGKISCWATRLL